MPGSLKKLLLLLLIGGPFVVKAADTANIGHVVPIDVEVHIIGFEVDASAEKQLQEMSAAAGGQYYSSKNNDDLTTALGAAAGVNITSSKTKANIQESEPNNRAETATPANPVGTITGRFSKNDVDHFIIDVDKQGEWTVSVSQAPDGIQFDLGVYPAHGGSWLANHSQEADKSLLVDLPYAGQYILKVNEKNRKSHTENYTLETNYIPTPDAAYEPNNKDEIAYPILANSPIVGAILPKSDVDYYMFRALESGEWTISIDKQPSSQQIGIGVYPASGGSWLTDNSEKGDNKLIVDLPQPGPYILKVHDINNKRSVSGYKLGSKFIPSTDKFEPNNRAVIASTVHGTGDIVATILPKGDNDYFIFDTKKAGEWNISISSQPDNWQIGLGVYPASGGSWLTDCSEKGDNKLIVDLPSPGRYILRAKEDNGKRSVLPYELHTVFTPSEDRYEPNNKAVVAKTISTSETITATILPKNDYDFYAVDIKTAGQWSIEIIEQPKNMQIKLGVYPASGGSWLKDMSEKGDNKLVVDIQSPGRYILKITEANSKRSVLPYRLQMQFQ